MIQDIGSNGGMMISNMGGPQMRPEGHQLTEDQKTALNEIISRYDPENLSDQDAESLREELKSAGIRPGRELESALNEAGFDMEQLAPPGPPPGPPPEGSEGVKLTDEQKNILDEILSRYDPANFSDEDGEALRAELKAADIFPSRELGDALKNAGFDIGPPPPDELPNGIIVDQSI